MVTKKSKVRRRFVVRNSGIHGKGVFATTHIPADTRLIEYKGKRLSEAQVDKRYANDDDPHTFLFALDDGMVIDATTGGNSARWINHSCAPNCEAVDDGNRIYIETLARDSPGPGAQLQLRHRARGKAYARDEALVSVSLRRAPLQGHYPSAEEEKIAALPGVAHLLLRRSHRACCSGA